MKIKKRRQAGVTILDLFGNLEGGEGNCRLVDVVREIGRGGDLELILNLRRVKWISSTGLGILVRARSAYLTQGGALHLCELSERDLSLMAITRTRLLFDVHETEAEALDAAQAKW